MVIGLIGFSAFQLFPRTLLGAFSASENMLQIGIPALRIISVIFLAAGFCVVAGSVCQALDKSMAAFVVSIFRQLVGLVPAAWLLSRLGNVNYVWWAFPFAEIFSALFSCLYLRKALRDMESRLALREAE
jgi:Na+-driven multidrug efflux pump